MTFAPGSSAGCAAPAGATATGGFAAATMLSNNASRSSESATSAAALMPPPPTQCRSCRHPHLHFGQYLVQLLVERRHGERLHDVAARARLRGLHDVLLLRFRRDHEH